MAPVWGGGGLISGCTVQRALTNTFGAAKLAALSPRRAALNHVGLRGNAKLSCPTSPYLPEQQRGHYCQAHDPCRSRLGQRATQRGWEAGSEGVEGNSQAHT